VIKPLTGTSGNGVQRFDSSDNALAYIERDVHDGWAISPFVSIKKEIRLIVLDQTILLSYEKRPVMINGLNMFNLGLGATPKKIEVSSTVRDLALRAAQSLRLRLAAVDVIETETGEYLILETNDGIMMEHYARASAEYEQDVTQVYTAIVETLFKN